METAKPYSLFPEEDYLNIGGMAIGVYTQFSRVNSCSGMGGEYPYAKLGNQVVTVARTMAISIIGCNHASPDSEADQARDVVNINLVHQP